MVGGSRNCRSNETLSELQLHNRDVIWNDVDQASAGLHMDVQQMLALVVDTSSTELASASDSTLAQIYQYFENSPMLAIP